MKIWKIGGSFIRPSVVLFTYAMITLSGGLSATAEEKPSQLPAMPKIQGVKVTDVPIHPNDFFIPQDLGTDHMPMEAIKSVIPVYTIDTDLKPVDINKANFSDYRKKAFDRCIVLLEELNILLREESKGTQIDFDKGNYLIETIGKNVDGNGDWNCPLIENETPSGSGFVIKRIGNIYYFLTAHHVIYGADKVQVMINGELVKVTVVAHHVIKDQDLAILKFESHQDIPVTEMGRVQDIKTSVLLPKIVRTVFTSGFPVVNKNSRRFFQGRNETVIGQPKISTKTYLTKDGVPFRVIAQDVTSIAEVYLGPSFVSGQKTDNGTYNQDGCGESSNEPTDIYNESFSRLILNGGIESGHSGGATFWNGKVVGVISSAEDIGSERKNTDTIRVCIQGTIDDVFESINSHITKDQNLKVRYNMYLIP